MRKIRREQPIDNTQRIIPQQVIVIHNQKGGVGKTTSAVNLAAGLGYYSKRTLLVDIDPQGNATSGVGFDKRSIEKSTYDILLAQAKAEEVILHTKYNNLDLMPAGIDLAAAEFEIMDAPDRLQRLKKALLTVKPGYDYIIIDCPPSLGIITTNALTACDSVLVPIQCEYYALEGLSQLMNSVRYVKRKLNEHIYIEGVLLTMYDGRLNLTQQVVSEVKQFFPKKVFGTVIPRGVRLSEAPSFGMPIMYYDKNCKGSEAYLGLAQELISKERTNG